MKMEKVKYSTRFALALFFDEIKVLKASEQPLNFIDNDSIFRFWSIENLKRTGTYEEPTSIVMHTNINFGASNSEEDKEKMKPVLFEKACSILPEIAEISSSSVKSHKWKYSQVHTFTKRFATSYNLRMHGLDLVYDLLQVLDSFEGKPGYVKLTEQIYAAGDGFSESGFEGCIDSAEKMIHVLKAALS